VSRAKQLGAKSLGFVKPNASSGPRNSTVREPARQAFAYDSAAILDEKDAGNRQERLMHRFESQLRGYRLTTAEILYHMPDHPTVLQSYIWQEFDLAPNFPILHRFLDFWRDNIEGRLHSVRVAARGLISSAGLGHAGAEFTLH
jgi:uncharacterized protein Usg